MFSPPTCATLNTLVLEDLVRENMPADLLERWAFTIASCNELELLLLVVNETSVASVLENKTKPAHRHTILKGIYINFIRSSEGRLSQRF